jgi:hypothetical protein
MFFRLSVQNLFPISHLQAGSQQDDFLNTMFSWSKGIGLVISEKKLLMFAQLSSFQSFAESIDQKLVINKMELNRFKGHC